MVPATDCEAMNDPTEDDYLRHIITDLEEDENPSYDHVGSLTDWSRYKAALARWVAAKDSEWDQIATDQEHGRER